MSHLALFLLGPPQIKLNDTPIEFDRRKAVALLAYLAVTGETHSRDTLATLLWSDYDQQRARAALRRTLSALNKALPSTALEVDRETISLRRSPDLWVDVVEFRQYLTSCLASEGDLYTTGLPLLTKAVTLYRADFMAGFTLQDSPNFDEWQLFQVENLRHDLASALSYLVRCHNARDEFDTAIAYAQRWLALDPLHEPAHRQLMQLYVWNDQRAAALRQYQECSHILKQELDVLPAEETTALYENIQRGALAQKSREPSEQFSTRLQAAAPMHNFPAQTTPFIDRRIELAEIAKRLQNPDCQLLTLIGPGGIGKTRLAIQAAIEHRTAFLDGLYFVSLAPVSSPDFLVSAVADSLNLSLDEQEDPKQQLLNHLQGRQILLVMDNFEHLVKGADLAANILTQASGVKILTTSRERLNLQGEWTFEVKGMPYPPDDKINQIEDYSAVALFLDKAYRVHSGFSLTETEKPHLAHICQLVEGMPLGIELAAAWVRLLSCQEIATEIERMYEAQHGLDFLSTPLHDVPERHQSLQAVFEHSWRLLSAEEKSAFRKLSVFQGGCRREAIEWVTGAPLPLLSALVDKSLLTRRASGRYEMHELLRQYATEKLHQTPTEAKEARQRHCEYFAQFLQRQETLLKGARHKEIFAEICSEIENVRSSWHWAVSQNDTTEIERMLKSLGRFYRMYGWFQEGVEAFGQAITTLQESDHNQALTGQLLAYQGWFLMRQGLYAPAREVLQQSITLFRQLDNRAELAAPLQFLGILTSEVGEYGEAKQLLQESLAIYREIDDQREIAWTLSNLGYCISNLEDGERFEAKQILQESLAIYKTIGDKQGIAIVLNNLGYVHYQLGEYPEAHQQFQESLALRREIGYPRGIAVALNNLGHVAGALEDYEAGQTHYNESLKITLDIQAIPLALDTLGGLAAPLAYAGKTSLALELLTLALHHPAGNKDTRNRAMRLLNRLQPDLPPEMTVILDTSVKDFAAELNRLAEAVLVG
jgi:predicted ATPase/DNA-binding SARP family transcriptional activator